MKQGILSRYAADPLSLVIWALNTVAAVWLIEVQLTGGRGQLSQLAFGFALGLLLGNQSRLLIGSPKRT